MASKGPVGTEMVGFFLNRYLERIVKYIAANGGDILKFAGDAMICMWNSSLNSVTPSDLVQQAVQCCISAQEEVNSAIFDEDVTLSVKFGIGFGTVYIVHSGGLLGRWEYVACGNPLTQAFGSESCASPGETVLSKQAYDLVKDSVSGEEVSPGFFKVAKKQASNLRRKRNKKKRSPIDQQLSELETHQQMREYLPAAVLPFLEIDKKLWAGELRKMTVMFINLKPKTKFNKLDEMTPEVRDEIDAIMSAVQKSLYCFEGSLNKFLVDDKGCTLLALFGLSPMAHSDFSDPGRAILTSFKLRKKLASIKVECSIGITTGVCLCSLVGTITRREYTVLGDVVNVSARLMGEAKTRQSGKVIIDKATYLEAMDRPSSTVIGFTKLKAIFLKGKSDAVEIYHPYKKDSLSVHPWSLDKTRKNSLESTGDGRRKSSLGKLILNTFHSLSTRIRSSPNSPQIESPERRISIPMLTINTSRRQSLSYVHKTPVSSQPRTKWFLSAEKVHILTQPLLDCYFSLFQAISCRTSAVLFVQGENGSGKSHLIDRLIARVSLLPSTCFLARTNPCYLKGADEIHFRSAHKIMAMILDTVLFPCPNSKTTIRSPKPNVYISDTVEMRSSRRQFRTEQVLKMFEKRAPHLVSELRTTDELLQTDIRSLSKFQSIASRGKRGSGFSISTSADFSANLDPSISLDDDGYDMRFESLESIISVLLDAVIEKLGNRHLVLFFDEGQNFSSSIDKMNDWDIITVLAALARKKSNISIVVASRDLTLKKFRSNLYVPPPLSYQTFYQMCSDISNSCVVARRQASDRKLSTSCERGRGMSICRLLPGLDKVKGIAQIVQIVEWTRDQIKQFTLDKLGIHYVDDPVLDLLMELTGSNPGHLSEFLKSTDFGERSAEFKFFFSKKVITNFSGEAIETWEISPDLKALPKLHTGKPNRNTFSPLYAKQQYVLNNIFEYNPLLPIPQYVAACCRQHVDRLTPSQLFILRVASVLCKSQGLGIMTFDIAIIQENHPISSYRSTETMIQDLDELMTQGYLKRVALNPFALQESEKAMFFLQGMCNFGKNKKIQSFSSAGNNIPISSSIFGSKLSKKIIDICSPPNRLFAFSSVFLMETVYQQMLSKQRNQLFGHFAQFFKIFAGRHNYITELAERLEALSGDSTSAEKEGKNKLLTKLTKKLKVQLPRTPFSRGKKRSPAHFIFPKTAKHIQRTSFSEKSKYSLFSILTPKPSLPPQPNQERKKSESRLTVFDSFVSPDLSNVIGEYSSDETASHKVDRFHRTSKANPYSIEFSDVDFFSGFPQFQFDLTSSHSGETIIHREHPDDLSKMSFEAKFLPRSGLSFFHNLVWKSESSRTQAILTQNFTAMTPLFVLDEFMTKNRNNWNIDVFQLPTLCNGYPLVFVGLYIFQRRGLLKKFSIDPMVFRDFLLYIENGYNYFENPYHGSLHACDVLLSVDYFIEKRPVEFEEFTDVQVLSVLLAAAIHDFRHPGVSNHFLKAIGDIRAEIFSHSYLEHMHAFEGIRIMKSKFNIFSNMKKEQQIEIQSNIVSFILTTNLESHFGFIDLFKQDINDLATVIDPRMLLLTLFLKCSDVSNPSRKYSIYWKWTNLIMEEFYRQGQLESVFPLVFQDSKSKHVFRERNEILECQVGFITYIVAPIFESLQNWTQKYLFFYHFSSMSLLNVIQENYNKFFL